MKYRKLEAVINLGHQIASGKAIDSPYPKGSIEMQAPYFKANGLDLDGYFLGTLNLSISPNKFVVKKPDFHFRDVVWAEGFPSEDFMFVRCDIQYKDKTYGGFVYYPDPKTKIGHFQDESTIEVISEYIEGIAYGDDVVLFLDLERINVI